VVKKKMPAGITSSGKAARASAFQRKGRFQHNVYTTWVPDEKPKSKQKAPVHEIDSAPAANTRRLITRERKVDETDFDDIKLNKQVFFDFSDGQSKLNREQLGRLLRAFVGVALSSDELDDIFSAADGNKDGTIDLSELPSVSEVVSRYLKTRQMISKTFEKYDANHDGKLDHEELRNLLTELNNGVQVAEQEVALVMKRKAQDEQGKMRQVELKHAINFWLYNLCNHQNSSPPPADRRKGGVIGRAMTGLHHHDSKNLK
jgi:Ca2+-binding EF-hand superfamily protein